MQFDDELYDATLPLLLRIARSHRVPAHDARDLVHEILLGYLRHDKPLEDPRTYFAAAMHYASASYWRRERRFVRSGEPVERIAPPPATAAIRARAILRRLPPRYSEVLWLRYVERCTVREVAARIGLSVSGTEKRLRRAKRRAAELAGEVLDETARWRVGGGVRGEDTYGCGRVKRSCRGRHYRSRGKGGNMNRMHSIMLLLLCASSMTAQTPNVQAPAQLQVPPRNGGDENRVRLLQALEKGDAPAVEKLYAQVPAKKSVYFEEIRACGFYPQETRLECIIAIKQQFGYGGPIASPGSREYVSFFVDCDGNGFQTTDYVGSGIVNVTDGSGGTQFAVYRDWDPSGGPRTSNGGPTTTTVTNGPICRAMAKLSWLMPVTNPNQAQVWGNDHFFTIRMMPIR